MADANNMNVIKYNFFMYFRIDGDGYGSLFFLSAKPFEYDAY